MDIRTYLKDNLLLFDGGMGTLCAEKIPESVGSPCELLNLTHPEQIAAIHKEYIEAGSKAIKTNTFGANALAMDTVTCRQVIETGFKIADKFAGEAYIFADIGPISVTDSGDINEQYRLVIDMFLNCGAVNFIFETGSSLNGLQFAADYIKAKSPDSFIILSFAAMPDGFTRSGQSAARLIKQAAELDSVDAVGLNCASGARHMAKLAAELPRISKYLSVMPNAGYPTVLGNRTFYDGDPSYFGRQIASIAANGARIVGGCCGTTPEHIAAAYKSLKAPHAAPITVKSDIKKQTVSNEFFDELCNPAKRPIAVELDPPENADIAQFMSGAKALKEYGASVITIADCPIARARMDSSILACKLHRELGIGVLPHLTCRDRNLNAIKALLLGLCAEGVHNILTVTGDPIPSASRDEVKSVYNFNSRMLAGYITALGEQSLPAPFHIFGALNVNARNFDVQLRIAAEKEANGVCGFLTQPVLTEQAVENLKRARATLKGKILGGIFPIVSHKNACFLNSEVAGIAVSDEIIAMYEGADREKGEELAVKISANIANIIHGYTDGYYLITPFSRTKLIGRIIKEISG